MKKFFCLLLSVVMVFSLLTGCGDDKKKDGKSDSDVSNSTVENSSSEEKEVNILKDDLVVVDKLSSAITEASKGSVATIKMGILVEFADDISASAAEIEPVLSYFGCTGKKIDLSVEMSAISTADGKGKVNFSLYGGNDKKVMSFDVITTGNDIYINLEQIVAAIEDLAVALDAPESAIKEMQDGIDSVFGGKKYIQINVQSLASLLGGMGSFMPEEEVSTEEMEKIVEIGLDFIEAIVADDNIVAGFEKLMSDIKIFTASDNSFTVKVTDKELVEFIDGTIDIIANNHETFGNAMFDTMLGLSAAGYSDMPISEADRKSFVDSFSTMKDTLNNADGTISDVFDKVGIETEFKLSIDEADENFFDSSASVSLYEKPKGGNALTISASASVKASSETVENISASDCISFETLAVLFSSMFEDPSIENNMSDSIEYDDSFDYGASFDYDELSF